MQSVSSRMAPADLAAADPKMRGCGPIADALSPSDRSRPGTYGVPDEIDLGHVAMLPGLVNAHTHLELSWMRGRIAETGDFPGWIRSVIALRQARDDNAERRGECAPAAIDEARRFGTALVGDISNTLATSVRLAERGLAGVVFYELLGFKTADAPPRHRTRPTLPAIACRATGTFGTRSRRMRRIRYRRRCLRAIRHALEEKPFCEPVSISANQKPNSSSF